MVKRTLQNGLIFFSTLIVMLNKCRFVFLNGNIYLFIFILVEIFFLISTMSNKLTFV
jgi:hypothetical protein